MFKNYPRYQYEVGRNITDFYNSLRFIDDFVANTGAQLQERYLSPGDTPEDISFELYGDDKYWFLILMMNGVKDAFYDWILTDEECHEYSIAYVDSSQTWDMSNPVEVTERQAQIDDIYQKALLKNTERTILVPTKELVEVIYGEFRKASALFSNDFR